jgi:hypothetical protein
MEHSEENWPMVEIYCPYCKYLYVLPAGQRYIQCTNLTCLATLDGRADTYAEKLAAWRTDGPVPFYGRPGLEPMENGRWELKTAADDEFLRQCGIAPNAP